jgi:hypothetical protein
MSDVGRSSTEGTLVREVLRCGANSRLATTYLAGKVNDLDTRKRQ